MNQARFGTLGGNGEDPPALFQQRRHPILDKVHEGLDRDQPGISGTGTVVPLGLQIAQELDYQWCINLLQLQCGGRNLEPPAGKLEQQPKRVGVALAGIGTGAFLLR